jgi:hypothetical protein
MKNVDKKWLPVGKTFEIFLADITRVYPGPGAQGLKLLQVGVSMSINDVKQPHIPMDKDKLPRK